MEPNEIVNIGKDGASRTERYYIGSEPWFGVYQQLMTLFMRQGGIVTSAYVQVTGDELHIALHGREGNMMYMRVKDFFVGKTKPPIKGDFLLHAAEETRYDKHNLLNLDTDFLREDPNYQSATDNAERCYAKLNVSQTETSRRSRNECVMHDLSGEAEMHLGISSMSLPIRTSRLINSCVSIRSIRSTNAAGDAGNIMIRNLTENGFSIPLVYSAHSSESNSPRGYNYNRTSISDVSLLTNMTSGIVYESIEPLALADINILYALEDGALKRAMSKIAKKRPFGLLQLHYDSEKKIAHMKTVNPPPVQIREGQCVEGTYQKVDMRFTKPGSLMYRDSRHESAAVSVNYGTVFDSFLSARRGNPSIAVIANALKGMDPSLPVSELIGISKKGHMILGVENEEITVLCTATTLGPRIELDAEYLAGLEQPAKVKKKSAPKRDSVTPVVQEPEEVEPEEPVPDLRSTSSLYQKWKKYSDSWHKERGLGAPDATSMVFMAYMNSGEVNQEDIDEFKRLTAHL